MVRTEIMKELDDILIKLDKNKYYRDNVLYKNQVIEDLYAYDERLIGALVNNELISKYFVKDISGNKVVKIEELKDVFEANVHWQDSFTNYENKIGLSANGRLIDETSDVVLDFPYKDSVLKAGMTKEDVEKEDDTNESYYHELIARAEIDTMLDKKILVNAKRYDSKGVSDTSMFKNEDNLIIKGNNLLALHTLKEKYLERVKLIYIDPPYYFINKTDDSFAYNSNFKLSTWLTFMKNRLEIAYDLLSDGGLICIQMNDLGVSYIKILCDEIFGVENFLNQVVVKMSEPTGVKMKHVDKRLPKLKEHILIYKKGDICLNPIMTPKESWDNEYKTFIKNFSREDYEVLLECEENKNLELADSILSRIEFAPLAEIHKEMKINGSTEEDDFNMENAYRIVQIASMQGGAKTSADEKRKYIGNVPAFSITSPNGIAYFIKNGYDSNKSTPRIKILFAERYLSVHVGDFWSDIKTTGLDNEGVFEFLNGKKPEKLLQRIISLNTKPNDIVLDFFMGSGTTQAVAMKMNRRFIGVEQMDYINTISVPRLQKVIEGEQGGVSKNVDWQGGGSFVYAELMPKSRGYIDSVKNAKNTEELKSVYNLMYDNVDWSFRVDLEIISDSIDDNDLTLAQKKELILKSIEKNQLYYNFSEIDDTNVRELISDSDYKFNQSFYGGE